MRSWPGRHRPRALTVAAIGAVVVAVVVSRLPFLHSGEIDWDEGVYWLSMQSMQGGHALFTSVYSSQPPAFLLFAEPVWALLGAGIAAGRAVMVGWAVVAVVAGSVIGWRLGRRVAAVAVAVTLAVDPMMVRQSVVLQADGPATALGLVAVALAVLAVTGRSRRWSTVAAALAGAALSIGLLTKFLDVAVVPPLLAVLVGRGQWRRLLVAAAAGGLIAAAAILLPLHDAWQAMWDQAVGLHLDTRSVTFGINLKNAVGSRWHLGAIAAVGAMIGWRRHRRLVITGALWVAGGMAAMAATHPLWEHHTVVVSPGYALLCAAGVSAAFGWLAGLGRRAGAVRAGVAVALVAVAGLFLWSGFHGLESTTDFRALASALAAHTPASASVEVVGDEQFAQAMAHRAAPPGFVDTSNTRMFAEPSAVQQLEAVADGDAPVCAVFFSSGRLAGLPGFPAWVTAHYPVSVSLGGSSHLYIAPGCG